MQDNKSRISLSCKPEEHIKIKVFAALCSMTISEYIMDCVRDKIYEDDGKIPNKETAKALEESAKGKGIKSYASIGELFEDLNL